MAADDGILALRTEIERLLAAALNSDSRHVDEMDRRDRLHIDETERRDKLHLDEVQRRGDTHEHELEMIRPALETRDVIGQAKGILIATLRCSPDEAFGLLRTQSQHENRKLIEVAIEVVQRSLRRPPKL